MGQLDPGDAARLDQNGRARCCHRVRLFRALAHVRDQAIAADPDKGSRSWADHLSGAAARRPDPGAVPATMSSCSQTRGARLSSAPFPRGDRTLRLTSDSFRLSRTERFDRALAVQSRGNASASNARPGRADAFEAVSLRRVRAARAIRTAPQTPHSHKHYRGNVGEGRL